MKMTLMKSILTRVPERNKIIAKVASILILVTAFIDTNLDVLQGIGLDDLTINWIKMIGLVLAAILPSLSFSSKTNKLNIH